MGHILFDIYIADLFLVINDIDLVSYADDNTIYFSNDCVNDVAASPLESAKKRFTGSLTVK